MKYLARNRIPSFFRVHGLVVTISFLTRALLGQSQVLVSYEDEMLPVVAMSGATPLVEVSGERLMVPDAFVRVENGNEFTDGSIEVLEHDALMGQDYGSALGGFFFRFVATVRAERDFEDCFILFAITPEKGENTYLLREIPDINTKGTERILITLPVNPGFGGGAFGYKIFSKGQEIRRYEPDDPIIVDGTSRGSTSSDDSVRRSSDASGPVEPAGVLQARLLDFPKSLMGKAGGGYASAIYSIDQEGRVIEIIDFAADHVEFIPEVWKTVVETRYEAGTYQGEPLVTTVRQNFFFNEFAPFSEALEMIPYPEMKDRDATPVYSPIPEVKVAKKVVLKVELLVSKLGRVVNAKILEGAESPAADETLEAVTEWIFLPAVIEGYPTDQTVTIPLSFGIKG
ncbi:energy transducer TonB [Pelagicoccus sp. SDUM812002]|uniref:energy transducer TonB family protein n=1 Tax=Pelagicoccus sp. SDUM812002 TaxID=3041266 RepID=UPI00280CF9DD|nr:energy transducer TonB [Pelagicoccus sp. SDUM812002]MDQ8185411.1 energy transducer TonB [Pelagicoccus sp. SDUM812002]